MMEIKGCWFEYMPKGSLENHLFDLDPFREPLKHKNEDCCWHRSWLEYLHCKVDPPVIYRDLKSSNILLDDDFNTKLSDFGLAKLGPIGDKSHVSTRVMGTLGYCAPDYAMSGKLTLKSDIYSFGVVLSELITGRRAIDGRKKPAEQNLVNWSCPLLKDQKRYPPLVDPLLQGRLAIRSLQEAVAIITMCIQDEAKIPAPHWRYCSGTRELSLSSRSLRASYVHAQHSPTILAFPTRPRSSFS